MCGFVSLLMLDGRPVAAPLLAAMRDTLSHRGPDGAGMMLSGPLGLGHRRLSIIDTSAAAHQPMCNEDRSVWLVFNGEIYNYKELTTELRAQGHHFRSHTDSEVILHLWEEMGERCVERLNGMFSFVIWDARRRTLFGARDRAGIKPFYYHHGRNRFITASEIKAILADPTVPRRADPQGVADTLFVSQPLGTKTTFDGISQLPPGHALSLTDGKLRVWEYWDVAFEYDHRRSLTDTTAELADLLDSAVRMQIRSDVPLGCHLSGGLDSSAITALAVRHQRSLNTFSIRFDGGEYFDESSHARTVATHLGTKHHEDAPRAKDLATHLATLAWHADIPMPDISSFSYFTAARLASRHVKVVLTGHGGDEVFAGYPSQFWATFRDASMFARPTRPVESVSLATSLRMGLRRYGLAGVAQRALRRAAPEAPETFEAYWIRMHCGLVPQDNHLLEPTFRRSLGDYDPRIAYLAPFAKARTDQILDRCLYHDLRGYLPQLLHQEDRSSMAVSIESRVPLLDHRIIEFLGTVPPEQKVVERVPKALLRRVATPLLPEAIVQRRDKGAFGVPTERWFAGELKTLVESIVYSPTARARGIFDAVELRSGVHGATGLWSALSFELWHRIHIDQDREWLDRIAPAVERRTRPALDTVEHVAVA